MISLTSELEHSIVIGNRIVEVDFTFDVVLKWYELLEDDSINDVEKTFIGFEMFVGTIGDYTEQQVIEAMQSISDYLSQSAYGNFDDEDIEPEFEVEPEPPTKYYSYTKDAEAIYASFLFDYNIDLVDAQGVMHWDKFKALFNNLSEKSPFQRIVNIRQTDPNEYKKDDPKAMQKIIEAQEFYRLEDEQNVQALDMQMSSMFDMLKNQAKGG